MIVVAAATAGGAAVRASARQPIRERAAGKDESKSAAADRRK
jgi:hypothetical protein